MEKDTHGNQGWQVWLWPVCAQIPTPLGRSQLKRSKEWGHNYPRRPWVLRNGTLLCTLGWELVQWSRWVDVPCILQCSLSKQGSILPGSVVPMQDGSRNRWNEIFWSQLLPSAQGSRSGVPWESRTCWTTIHCVYVGWWLRIEPRTLCRLSKPFTAELDCYLLGIYSLILCARLLGQERLISWEHWAAATLSSRSFSLNPFFL